MQQPVYQLQIHSQHKPLSLSWFHCWLSFLTLYFDPLSIFHEDCNKKDQYQRKQSGSFNEKQKQNTLTVYWFDN